MRDLRPRIGLRYQPQRSFVSREHMVDGDIAIGMAVELDSSAVHALAPPIEILLRFSDVALIARGRAGIRDAHGHGALRKRAIRGVLKCRAQLDPFIAQSGGHAPSDHRLEFGADCFIAHPMQKPAARTHFRKGTEISTLMTDAREPESDELLGDIGQTIAIAPHGLIRGKSRSLADLVK